MNHFHDPLKPWLDAGIFFNLSSLVWAQSSNNVYSSWPVVRRHYYNALKTGNEDEWAWTFEKLGCLMHLVSDAAVPAHVRNDKHPLPEPYEAWAKTSDQHGQISYSPIKVDPNIFQSAVHNQDAPVPISALWDQDKYIAGGVPFEDGVGLAEYTNAYFYSEDTIGIGLDPPHPSPADIGYNQVDWKTPVQVITADGKVNNRIYLRNLSASTQHIVAAVSFFYWDCVPDSGCLAHSLILDDTVHRSYAQLLVPRAVGYSAALVDYFFQETIDTMLRSR